MTSADVSSAAVTVAGIWVSADAAAANSVACRTSRLPDDTNSGTTATASCAAACSDRSPCPISSPDRPIVARRPGTPAETVRVRRCPADSAS